MKLIDIEAEINRVCLACCGYERKDCKWLAYGEGEGCNQIQELEEGLKVVEAITIEWLISRCVRAYDENDTAMRDCIGVLIDEWQEEQEE